MEAAAGVVGGTIYVGGGGPFSNNGKPYVYAYDPAKNAWTIQPPLRIARSSAMAVTLDGRLYEIGGWQRDTGVVLSSVEVFQP
jgi:N-acetylneuraminic acid mutarotase